MTDKREQAHKLLLEGTALLRSGRPSEALLHFLQAETIEPANAAMFLHTGAALHELKRYEEAIEKYVSAIRTEPTLGEAYNNLGNSLMAVNRFAEAAESFSNASHLLPSSAVPLAAGATALQALGLVREAETACRSAVAISPDFAAAHWNLALNLLLQGRYSEGWQEYEWRWRKPDFTSPTRYADISLWDGSALDGRTIILHAEQGFGDAIQFVRYVPLVARRGGRVVLECHPPLVQLFRGVEGVEAVFAFGGPPPPCSCQAPLLTLPRLFETTLQSIPSEIPYISSSLQQRAKWSSLLSASMSPSTLRVGLVWAGKSFPDPLRSCRLSDLAPLASLADVTYFSLQVGSTPDESHSGDELQLVNLTEHIHDFSDTAALIEQLDVIISIDSAVAHLAAALGKPVLLLLPFAPDWRWMLERNDSPWYPSMLLFRQKQAGVWGPVIREVENHLRSGIIIKTPPYQCKETLKDYSLT